MRKMTTIALAAAFTVASTAAFACPGMTSASTGEPLVVATGPSTPAPTTPQSPIILPVDD